MKKITKVLMVLVILVFALGCEGMQGKPLNEKEMNEATKAIESTLSQVGSAIATKQKEVASRGGDKKSLDISGELIEGIKSKGKVVVESNTESGDVNFKYDVAVKFDNFGYETEIDGETVGVKINGTINLKYDLDVNYKPASLKFAYDFKFVGKGLSISINDKALDSGKIYFLLKIKGGAGIGENVEAEAEFKINGQKFEGTDVSKKIQLDLNSFKPEKN